MEQTDDRKLYRVPILFLVSIYAPPILHIILFTDSEGIPLLELPLLFAPYILAVANVRAAMAGYRNESRAFLLNSAVLLKYGLVPFFVVCGGLVVALSFSTLIPVPFMIIVGPTGAMMVLAIMWAFLASGSAYSLAYLLVARRDGVRTHASVMVHAVLQFMFITDVISVMVLTWQERRWRGLTVAVAIEIIVIAIALLVGAVWFISTIVSAFNAAAV